MTIHDLTREQLVALCRQQANALEAQESVERARARCAGPKQGSDGKRYQHELDEAEAHAASLRKAALAKWRPA